MVFFPVKSSVQIVIIHSSLCSLIAAVIVSLVLSSAQDMFFLRYFFFSNLTFMQNIHMVLIYHILDFIFYHKSCLFFALDCRFLQSFSCNLSSSLFSVKEMSLLNSRIMLLLVDDFLQKLNLLTLPRTNDFLYRPE